jgi:hypothetical protein
MIIKKGGKKKKREWRDKEIGNEGRDVEERRNGRHA